MATPATLCVLLLLALASASGKRHGLSNNRLKLRKQLKHLNKHPLKSVKSPDGDIIDCVRIARQRAFDNVLLQNHTIQMKPGSRPRWISGDTENAVSSSSKEPKRITQLWQTRGSCPKGTIPVRRTKRKDLLRARSIKSYGKKRARSVIRPSSRDPDFSTQSGHQHAIAYVDGGEFYGAKATLNVWQPKIEQRNEFSLSQIWILAGNFGEDLNSIEAGWQVSPDLYGDNKTRLFTYWTSDAYQATGCYNLLCSGFIQISNEVAMGASIYPISSFKDSQYDINLLVWKDPSEGNWWMQFGNDVVLGYWPGFLFPYLSESASVVEWGGEVVDSEAEGRHSSTQMGSGHFPNEGFGKASYFRNIQVVDASNSLRDPKGLHTFTQRSECYDVKTGKNHEWGSYLYYGGPGRNPDCE